MPGDLRDEQDVLKWLLHQKESDEIEDVTAEMLDRLVKETKHLAVLFCEHTELPIFRFGSHAPMLRVVAYELVGRMV